MSNNWRSFFYGGVAAMMAECVTFPMDTAKTRLQIQGQHQTTCKSIGKLKYKGMIHTFIKITKEEGVIALYSGLKPALLRQATYGSLKFGIYKTLKEIMKKQGLLIDAVTGEERVLTNIFCAAMAGATASVLANPTDVLKVRLQHNPDLDRSLYRGFIGIYKLEGIRGLWRGVSGTAQRAAVVTAVGLPAYDFFKYNLTARFGDKPANHFISAGIASSLGALISTPFDVLRTRVMNDHRKAYTGILNCFIKTIRNEGVRALYKGFIPTWFRMGPWNIIFFITYEQLKQFY